MIGSQTEFGLSVAVCAWCKPGERGSGLGAVSHGICLRHLRKLKLEVHGLLAQTPKRRHSRRTALDSSEALLPL